MSMEKRDRAVVMASAWYSLIHLLLHYYRAKFISIFSIMYGTMFHFQTLRASVFCICEAAYLFKCRTHLHYTEKTRMATATTRDTGSIRT